MSLPIAPSAARAAAQAERARALYRQSLKTILSWCVQRDLFYSEVDRCRAAFDENKGVKDPATIDKLIADGEELLKSYKHPDPYIIPWAAGGSKYARNAPVPSEIHLEYGFGGERK